MNVKQRDTFLEYSKAIRRRRGILAVCIGLVICTVLLYVPQFSPTVRITALFVIDLVSVQEIYHPIRLGLVFATIIVLGYFASYEYALIRWKRRLGPLRPDIESIAEGSQERERLLDISRQGRESGMLGTGSLIIPTAFFLLAAAATAQKDVISVVGRETLAFSAPLLYMFWLFSVQLPTRLMDDIDSKMKEYAKGRTHGVLHTFYEDRHGFGVMMRLRRNHWLAYVPLLTVAATLIVHSIVSP